MIKKQSILLLSTLFIISTSSFSSLSKLGASGCGPHMGAKKQHPTVVPATGADTKAAQEKSPQQNSPSSTGSAPQTSSPTKPTITIAIPGAAFAAASVVAAPATSSSPNANSKQAAELKKITMIALINRQSSFINVLPNSLNKKLQGADVVVLGALAGLKKSEEVLDCQESDTQAQLSSAVQAIIKTGNLQNAEELLRLSDINEIFIDKTQRENLRQFIAGCQRNDDKAFQDDYNKECTALQEKVKRHIQRSKYLDSLIDGTYKLGGRRNLSEEEVAFLQGNRSKLTKEQQQALAKKQADRVKAGLSDNEEEHPEYVDPTTIIKVPASELSILKPGAKSLKSHASASAAAKK